MKASELRGTTVITVLEGERIGTVENVLVHAREQKLAGLLLKSSRFPGLQVLLTEDIASIGRDAITMPRADKLQDEARFERAEQLVTLEDVTGHKVVTASGNYAGDLADIEFDPESGKITGYIAAGGLFAKMFGRTHVVEASDQTRLGKDVLIVPDEVVSLPTDQVETPTRA